MKKNMLTKASLQLSLLLLETVANPPGSPV